MNRLILLLLVLVGCGARARPILQDAPRPVFAWRTMDDSALALMWLVLVVGFGLLLVTEWRHHGLEQKDGAL